MSAADTTTYLSDIQLSRRRLTGILLVLLTAVGVLGVPLAYSAGYPPETIASASLSAAVFGTLLLAHRRGWDGARYLAVVLMTLLVAFGLPEPFVSQQGSLVIIVPPLIALMLADARWVVGSACGVIGLLIVRAGGHSAYTELSFFFSYTMVLGGLLLNNAVLSAALRAAVAHARRAERHEAEAYRRLRDVQALRTIDQAIATSHNLNATLDVVLQQVTERLEVDAADVLLLEPETQLLVFGTGRGFRTDALRHTRLRLGEGYAGQAALERRTIHAADLAARPGELSRATLLAGERFVAYYGVPLVAGGEVRGVLEIFHRSPLERSAEWVEFLEILAGQAAIAIDNAELFDRLRQSNVDLVRAYDATIEGWSRALDLRDHETEGHSRRVTEMTLRLARRMGLDEAALVHVRRGALLHDIGKMGIPDAILLKPGKLTAEEWAVMRMHPVYAYKLLAPIAFLRPALDIPYCHHERWDGTGYPRGLAGEAIPLAARIFAVVDVWDALSNDRPYRPAWPRERVLAHIRAESGRHFDPLVVEALVSELEAEGLPR
ncbi:MAG TPA: HD domain-containing phosphohydrolase [Roseiflexaceae bacterium]|nr:HD domain-containing phosphohydrolase [Roseiflexaceae bacterium]